MSGKHVRRRMPPGKAAKKGVPAKKSAKKHVGRAPKKAKKPARGAKAAGAVGKPASPPSPLAGTPPPEEAVHARRLVTPQYPFLCPGERYPITRAVCIGRQERNYDRCLACPHADRDRRPRKSDFDTRGK